MPDGRQAPTDRDLQYDFDYLKLVIITFLFPIIKIIIVENTIYSEDNL